MISQVISAVAPAPPPSPAAAPAPAPAPSSGSNHHTLAIALAVPLGIIALLLLLLLLFCCLRVRPVFSFLARFVQYVEQAYQSCVPLTMVLFSSFQAPVSTSWSEASTLSLLAAQLC